MSINVEMSAFPNLAIRRRDRTFGCGHEELFGRVGKWCRWKKAVLYGVTHLSRLVEISAHLKVDIAGWGLHDACLTLRCVRHLYGYGCSWYRKSFSAMRSTHRNADDRHGQWQNSEVFHESFQKRARWRQIFQILPHRIAAHYSHTR